MCGRNLRDMIPNGQLFLNPMSIQISRPYPRANSIIIRINSLIVSDLSIRLPRVMSANQII